MDNFERFCPVCKNKNERDAVICRYCGASLHEIVPHAAVTTRNTGSLSAVPVKLGELPLERLTPSDGIAIYIAGTAKPVFLYTEAEFAIGRKADGDVPEPLLNLSESEYDGFNMGISRRHAKVRRTDSGYEVIDLSSTNGTWLNDERLIPNKPYPMTSGSQLRVGRLRFIVLYRSDSQSIEKK